MSVLTCGSVFKQASPVVACKYYVTKLHYRENKRHFGSNKVRNILVLSKSFYKNTQVTMQIHFTPTPLVSTSKGTLHMTHDTFLFVLFDMIGKTYMFE